MIQFVALNLLPKRSGAMPFVRHRREYSVGITEFRSRLEHLRVMQQRAVQLGYRPVKPGELDYLSVPGFVAPEPPLLLAAEDVTQPNRILPEAYTQSLIEWLDERIRFGGVQ